MGGNGIMRGYIVDKETKKVTMVLDNILNFDGNKVTLVRRNNKKNVDIDETILMGAANECIVTENVFAVGQTVREAPVPSVPASPVIPTVDERIATDDRITRIEEFLGLV